MIFVANLWILRIYFFDEGFLKVQNLSDQIMYFYYNLSKLAFFAPNGFDTSSKITLSKSFQFISDTSRLLSVLVEEHQFYGQKKRDGTKNVSRDIW